jgi:hypothetical protein
VNLNQLLKSGNLLGRWYPGSWNENVCEDPDEAGDIEILNSDESSFTMKEPASFPVQLLFISLKGLTPSFLKKL